MIRIVPSVVSLLVLAVLIALNLGYNTSFNLFGSVYEGIPVLIIAIFSFILGIAYSFIFYISNYLAKKNKNRIKNKNKLVKDKDQELKEKE